MTDLQDRLRAYMGGGGGQALTGEAADALDALEETNKILGQWVEHKDKHIAEKDAEIAELREVLARRDDRITELHCLSLQESEKDAEIERVREVLDAEMESNKRLVDQELYASQVIDAARGYKKHRTSVRADVLFDALDKHDKGLEQDPFDDLVASGGLPEAKHHYDKGRNDES